MHVKHIRVTGFRGIRSLNWSVENTIIGLVGPGDSTKTTILDAIEYVLLPHWSLPISDGDFYGGKPDSPILIEVTVGNIPSELLKDDKFGLYLRGWMLDRSIVDEPDDDCTPVLTIRLSINTNLESSWAVVTDRHPEGKPISWRDRARLGVVRLGANVDRDLAWGRGSSLSRLTGRAGVEDVLAEAYRKARASVAEGQLPSLMEAAGTAASRARMIGVTPAEEFRPALDPAAMSIHLGALSLHDGPIPVRAAGLGTRRLVALAIQQAVVPDGAILLIDEIEHALEPHRIRRLIRHIRTLITSGNDGQESNNRHGQVVMTTHSPVAIVELNVDESRVVRSNDGETKVLAPDSDLQGVIRSMPDALLGKRLVVCEGPTEVGICWGLEKAWQKSHSDESTACRGVVFIDGGGSNAPKRAQGLKRLGYEVAYFADSDREVNPTVDELSSAGIQVICWDGSVNTEQRIFSDLPWEIIQKTFDYTIEEHGEESVITAVANKLELDPDLLTHDLNSWITDSISKQTIREALGLASKGTNSRDAWYKRYDRGERLAEIIIEGLPQAQDTDLENKLKLLENWCYA